MMDQGNLVHRFLGGAKDYLDKNGVIIMPFFHLAGLTNDPGIQAPRHGYEITQEYQLKVTTGLQQGNISIYEIKYKTIRSE